MNIAISQRSGGIAWADELEDSTLTGVTKFDRVVCFAITPPIVRVLLLKAARAFAGAKWRAQRPCN